MHKSVMGVAGGKEKTVWGHWGGERILCRRVPFEGSHGDGHLIPVEPQPPLCEEGHALAPGCSSESSTVNVGPSLGPQTSTTTCFLGALTGAASSCQKLGVDRDQAPTSASGHRCSHSWVFFPKRPISHSSPSPSLFSWWGTSWAGRPGLNQGHTASQAFPEIC